MSYRELEIWQMARELSVDIHRMTLTKLPKFEMFEEASQIRRAIKSVRANIVEGYGRRRYKQEFIKHLVYAHASCDESTDHLLTLYEYFVQHSVVFIQVSSADSERGSAAPFIKGIEIKPPYEQSRTTYRDPNPEHERSKLRFRFHPATVQK